MNYSVKRKGKKQLEDNNYLSSMIGRVVQIYRGGPDSNNGWLLDVNEDYLTLQKDDGEIIYYKTAHIKSIREDTMIKYNSLLSIDGKNPILKAPTFNELASNLKEQTVRINGKGPESKEGQLVDVKEDYMTLYTEEDGFIFFNEQHIKSLSFPTENKDEKEDEKEEKTTEVANNVENSEVAKNEESSTEEINNGLDALKEVYGHIFADKMHGVLTNLKYSWIKVNRKGPESLEGMLVDSNDNHLVIVVDNEILRVSTFHVKNFSVKNKVVKDESSEKDSKENNSKEKDSNKQESKDKSKNNNQNNEKQDKESNKNQDQEKQPFTQQEINKIIRKRKRRYQNRIQQQGKKGK